jgi:hypothetical protein
LKQGILSSIWLEVIGSDELKCNNLETRTNLFNWKDATYYKYGDAKVNLKGRGSLGFGWSYH